MQSADFANFAASLSPSTPGTKPKIETLVTVPAKEEPTNPLGVRILIEYQLKSLEDDISLDRASTRHPTAVGGNLT